ncbi:glucose 1-dehydrogenase [Alsobacter sp. SYSU M60028]|uniref:Glucose 1-dehydrogenase n=1 Tax=Alsobacter ponti TaxID=2962936 RepID=A0ABT1L7U8_9HYPH|nr:glucose 1-dehydrogenase [Alsobacter ponti]MCP8937013.1 glucose 1-dehydrogenase [Alsobacter ponti]
MIEDLKGKVALVTGASTGIGAAAAKGFAANGVKVAVHYNASADAARAVVDAIRDAGGEAMAVRGDVTRPEDVKRIVAETLGAFGRIDVLVNNAGGMLGRRALAEIDDAHYERVMQLNAWSVLAFMREIQPVMRAQGGGAIINVTSIAARNGGGGGAVLYAASKAFVSNFTRGMAKELWADRIRVNGVAPGVIDTPFHDRYSNAQQIEAMRQSVPMGRVGAPDDCVGAFLFLASDALSGYMIGQILEVNGGQLMP